VALEGGRIALEAGEDTAIRQDDPWRRRPDPAAP
jgi:hypothetical protein